MFNNHRQPARSKQSEARFKCALLLAVLAICGCSLSRTAEPMENLQGTSMPTPAIPAPVTNTATASPATRDPYEAARRTLLSLEKVDDYPFYTMTYTSDYSYSSNKMNPRQMVKIPALKPAWGCSLFAALGDAGNPIYGRNFDWDFSPALLLFTDPPDGYASVSMVDLANLVGVQDYNRLVDLPLEDRRALLEAPWVPFDGMNEAGVAIAMAAVPPGNIANHPEKVTIDSILVMREVLDHAGTVHEAVAIFEKYNIAWGNAPVMHYMIADRSGKASLIEYSGEKLAVIRNRDPWLIATNFLVSEAGSHPEGKCWRYKRIGERLTEAKGRMTVLESMNLLAEVAQTSPHSNTQWSVLYGLHTGEVQVVLGQQYDRVYTFSLTGDPQTSLR